MSVTTSTEKGVSIGIRKYARSDTEISVSEGKPARANVFAVAQRILSIIPPLTLGLFLLIGWYVSTAFGHVNSLVLPAPGDVLASLSNGLSSGLFLSNALVTIQESLLGFLLALVVALPLGYGLAKSRFIAATVQPYLAAGQAIPAIVIAPILIIWVGYGLVPIGRPRSRAA